MALLYAYYCHSNMTLVGAKYMLTPYKDYTGNNYGKKVDFYCQQMVLFAARSRYEQ